MEQRGIVDILIVKQLGLEMGWEMGNGTGKREYPPGDESIINETQSTLLGAPPLFFQRFIDILSKLPQPLCI